MCIKNGVKMLCALRSISVIMRKLFYSLFEVNVVCYDVLQGNKNCIKSVRNIIRKRLSNTKFAIKKKIVSDLAKICI